MNTRHCGMLRDSWAVDRYVRQQSRTECCAAYSLRYFLQRLSHAQASGQSLHGLQAPAPALGRRLPGAVFSSSRSSRQTAPTSLECSCRRPLSCFQNVVQHKESPCVSCFLLRRVCCMVHVNPLSLFRLKGSCNWFSALPRWTRDGCPESSDLTWQRVGL